MVKGESLPDRYVELGYILRRNSWGRGIATEAAGRLVQFAFEVAEIDPVVAIIDEPNDASRRVLRKLGFEEAGYRRAYAEQSLAFTLAHTRWAARNQPDDDN